MTLIQELASWNPLNLVGGPKVAKVPAKGDKAPSSGELSFPRPDSKPVVVAFLRHCGCPFAEKTFRQLRDLAASNSDVSFFAISHSDQASTKKWLDDVGGKGSVRVIVDDGREIYAAWGLGSSSFWHVLQPSALGALGPLKKNDGIDIRPTSSGSRWQTAGNFAVDAQGTVVWGRASEHAGDIPSPEEGIAAVRK